MRVYITRYALQSGIIQVRDADHGVHVTDGSYVSVRGDWRMFKIGRDAFLTLDDAKRAAESARKRKIASHSRSVERLAAMTFAAAESTP